MRSIKESILSTTKVGRFDEWGRFKREHAHPKDGKELESTIKQAIKIKGNDVDLNWIDTSAIKNMSGLFKTIEFNGDISKWDVGRVKNMSEIFNSCPLNENPPEWYINY